MTDRSPPSDFERANSREKEVLHGKFSTAAAALTDLFRESTNAYEAGYRDALLYVHRYVLLTSVHNPQMSQLGSTHVHNTTVVLLEDPAPGSTAAAPPLPGPWAAAPTLSTSSVVASEKMLRFLHNTIQRRKDRVAAERGIAEHRRRQRPDGTEDEFASLEHCCDSDDGANELSESIESAATSTRTGGALEESSDPAFAIDSLEVTVPCAHESTGSEDDSHSHQQTARTPRWADRPEEKDTLEPPRQTRRCHTPAAPSRYP